MLRVHFDRSPNDVFVKTSRLILTLNSIYNLLLTSLLSITILKVKNYRTVFNVLTVNSCLGIVFYSVTLLLQLAILEYFNGSVSDHLCQSLAYVNLIGVNIICYSYLVTAISQYLFNNHYNRKYLLTVRIHLFIISMSWIVCSLLPLVALQSGSNNFYIESDQCFLFLSGLLKYVTEIRMCTLNLRIFGPVLAYMVATMGIPNVGINIIYFLILRYTRRVDVAAFTLASNLSRSRRNLKVIRNILVLVGILGTAGLPVAVIIFWNAIAPGTEPIELHLISVLVIATCTNVQSSFLFLLNRQVRRLLSRKLRQYIRWTF